MWPGGCVWAAKFPACVYGAGKESLPVTLDPRQVTRILHSKTGHNTIFDLDLEGGERTKAMIVDWQYEPIKGHLLHIDLKRIAMDRKLTVSVPIVLKGEAAGVKQQGGILEQILREVEVECLPGDIPSAIEADVSELVFGKVLRVSDLTTDDKDRIHYRSQSTGSPHHHGERGSGSHAGSSGGRSRRHSCRARSHQEGQAGSRGRRGCGGRSREAGKGREERKEVVVAVWDRSRSWGRVGACPEQSRRDPSESSEARQCLRGSVG